jgi:acyl-CoA thioesterase FadM
MTAVCLHKTVSWGECDPAGVVYTPRFANYAVEAFHYFLAEMLGRPLQQRLGELGLGTPMKAMHFEFHKSLWPDQAFFMEVYVVALRTRSFDLKVVGKDDTGAACFNAVLSPVCINAAVRSSVPIPDVLRQRLEEYQRLVPLPASS